MIDVDLVDLWRCHFQRRVSDAMDIGMLRRGTEFPYLRAILPAALSTADLDGIAPNTSLRSLSNEEQSPAGWVHRPDLLEDVATWTKAVASARGQKLIAEAGWSQPGDLILQSRPHLIHDDNVYFVAEIEKASALEITTLLRRSRSDRLLAAVVSEINFPLCVEVFICDHLQGDAALIGLAQDMQMDGA